MTSSGGKEAIEEECQPEEELQNGQRGTIERIPTRGQRWKNHVGFILPSSPKHILIACLNSAPKNHGGGESGSEACCLEGLVCFFQTRTVKHLRTEPYAYASSDRCRHYSYEHG